MPKTVLAIAAEPQDAETAAGGLLAKYARRGRRILIAIAADGAQGGIAQRGPALAARRKGESRRAAAMLGAAEPIFLDWPEFELDSLPRRMLRERLVRLIREVEPDTIVLQDPREPDTHPDRRVLADAASDAAFYSMLPGLFPEHLEAGLKPWYVPEKLFYSESSAGANYFVDISDVIGLKIDALLAHESQVEFLVEEILAQAAKAGLDPEQVAAGAGAGVSGEEGPSALAALAVQRRAARIGARAGFAFGESFRRVRFHTYVEEVAAKAAQGEGR
jgi:LmbE family N-acetylglucosaminyl deacetylase